MPDSDFDAHAYWEQRLAAEYSLTGVGFRRLGPSFNLWAYKVRRERFLGAVRRLSLDPSGAEVVDRLAVLPGGGAGPSCRRETMMAAAVPSRPAASGAGHITTGEPDHDRNLMSVSVVHSHEETPSPGANRTRSGPKLRT
jgi:hypothetical protein